MAANCKLALGLTVGVSGWIDVSVRAWEIVLQASALKAAIEAIDQVRASWVRVIGGNPFVGSLAAIESGRGQ
jgi:hypothetical protein